MPKAECSVRKEEGAQRSPRHKDSEALSSRAKAAAIIERWLETGVFPGLMLDDVREHRAFLMELVYGVVRWKRLLDWVVSRYVRRSPDPAQQAFLLVGLYQLLKMTDVAAFAAVHETVEAAKARLGPRQADFINALLRRTLREKDSLMADMGRQPLGIRQSHPDELLDRWIRNFGFKNAEALCDWNNRRADVIIHLNRLKIAPEEYLKALAAKGQADFVKPFPAAACFVLNHGVRVEDLPGYREGHFTVIDPAAVQAVELLDPQLGDNVLDACAAPGGKTALIAERMRLQGHLVAMDICASRLPRLRANLERMGCAAFVKVEAGDARRASSQAAGLFDRILLDVPCSNTGVIRRKPDIRWRFSTARLARLGQIQRELLDHLAGLLKVGGSIVYSTCSLEPEENEIFIRTWLKNHPGFCMRNACKSLPPDSGRDGAYAVRLQRRS